MIMLIMMTLTFAHTDCPGCVASVMIDALHLVWPVNDYNVLLRSRFYFIYVLKWEKYSAPHAHVISADTRVPGVAAHCFAGSR